MSLANRQTKTSSPATKPGSSQTNAICMQGQHAQGLGLDYGNDYGSSSRTLAWHFGNAITAFCFRSALLPPLPLFAPLLQETGTERQIQKIQKERLPLPRRGLYSCRCLSSPIFPILNIYNGAELHNVICIH